ncbi:MAG: aminodeoxychorismate synthase component I [Proteobacteria bacterium]|nr:aminodeoxychorismate synthase component I [Pseudomonadota bacterium]
MTERIREIAGPADLRRLHRDRPSRYPFLLQSTAAGRPLGQYDILFASPGEAIVAGGGEAFLARLDAAWRRRRIAPRQTALPFNGGWFVYLGYGLAAEIEPGLALERDAVLPAAFAVRCRAALIFDHAAAACYLVAESPRAVDRDVLMSDIAALRDDRHAGRVRLEPLVEEDPGLFTDAVAAAKEYIAAGDIYQANLSREWSSRVYRGTSASDIYAALCKANPAPFAGLARWRGTDIISSSPERLLRVRDGIASTRPIAGTRPRSDDAVEDGALLAELIAHPKERAEHVMLVDLERNDLGRVCEAGTVEVSEMMVAETYAHVHHIVSNVRGRLRAGATPGQVIAAVFPGGTITGCPKVRCMEIIGELERGSRGAYTGSFGYLDRDGSMDLNILIRTIVKDGERVTFRAGSGIVADSDPAAELAETRAKAEGMQRAIVP